MQGLPPAPAHLIALPREPSRQQRDARRYGRMPSMRTGGACGSSRSSVAKGLSRAAAFLCYRELPPCQGLQGLVPSSLFLADVE